MGKNPVSILIPCHRVLGSGGKLTGYAGGLDAKKILLDCEEVWEDAKPRLRKCAVCKTEKEHNVKVGFIRRENGSAKWEYIGSRCTNCGVLASYLDWKISYEPTDEMEKNI